MAKIQLEAGGVFLDLYETDLPKITLSVQDATTFEATTAFTQQFRIPATTHNSQYFETAFMVNGLDFDVTQKRPATILVDGSEYKRGEIRLQNVYINEQSGKVDYGIVFIGEIRDLVSSLNEARLCDLELLHLTHSFNIAAITSSWEAYPETPSSNDDGLLSGSVLYPLVDFGNTYADNGDTLQPRIARNYPAGDGGSFDQSGYPLTLDRFRPMIKCKDIVDEIFSNAGYEYQSGFLNSSLFRHLYVSAWGDEAVPAFQEGAFGVDTGFGVVGGNSNFVNSTGVETEMNISFTFQDLGNNFDLADNSYVAPFTGDYTFNTEYVLTHLWDIGGAASVDVQIRIRKNGTQVDTETFTLTAAIPEDYPYETTDIVNTSHTLTLNAGDIITTTAEFSNDTRWFRTIINFQSYLECASAEGDASPAKGLSCDMTQLDFLKGLQQKFNLQFSPIKGKPYCFRIEPWDNFIAAGDVFDWTDKLDLSKDLVITPLLTEQTARIEFKDKAGTDYLSALNVDQFDESYGQANIVNRSELLTGTKKIESVFTSVPSTQIINATQTGGNGMDNTIIPQLCVTKIDDASGGTPFVKYEPIKPTTRIYWYNGIKHTGTTSGRDKTWYIEDENGVNQSFTKFPMISEFNEWGDRDDSWQGLDTQTRTLSYQKENTYIQFGLAQLSLGSGMYNQYWANYIQSLYDVRARRLTAHFILDGQDLLDFDFQDVIFVKDTYYYVQKIYNASVGEKKSVKVDLIKLPNYTPDTGNFVQTLPWEDMIPLWNTWTGEWEIS